jgi:hypothetical protein
MFKALSPQFLHKPGQLEKTVPYGVRVGYGGPGRHPKAKATVFDIARMHDQGLGNVPQRQIIVKPIRRVTRLMAQDMERALKRMSHDMITR